jgi:hypothetical protein
VLVRVLREHGELDRARLAMLAEVRLWGPRRFRTALREAVDEGRVRRVSRGSYAPAER